MSSRDIHSRDGGYKVRDLFGSLLITETIQQHSKQPCYLISPWISDFILLNNAFGQYRDLFTYEQEIGEQPNVLFSEMLLEISNIVPVRVLTWNNKISARFAQKVIGSKNIEIRYETNEKDHQKGFLSKRFYFEGSMNFTYSGVYKNKEKVTCTNFLDQEGQRKIDEAFLEFDRIWLNLS